mmetsp:Transcript_7957/g.17176  ORF Transcript_7957/g.17176 Transcript_7957/m.17176 type:complete len:210 (-) Transcript_7957:3249-3878(-)
MQISVTPKPILIAPSCSKMMTKRKIHYIEHVSQFFTVNGSHSYVWPDFSILICILGIYEFKSFAKPSRTSIAKIFQSTQYLICQSLGILHCRYLANSLCCRRIFPAHVIGAPLEGLLVKRIAVFVDPDPEIDWFRCSLDARLRSQQEIVIVAVIFSYRERSKLHDGVIEASATIDVHSLTTTVSLGFILRNHSNVVLRLANDIRDWNCS